MGGDEERASWQPQVGALAGAAAGGWGWGGSGEWGGGGRPPPAVVEDCVGRQLQRHEDDVEACEEEREPTQVRAPAEGEQGLQGGSRGCRGEQGGERARRCVQTAQARRAGHNLSCAQRRVQRRVRRRVRRRVHRRHSAQAAQPSEYRGARACTRGGLPCR